MEKKSMKFLTYVMPLLFFASLILTSCESIPKREGMQQATVSAPTQAQLEQIAKANTFIGTIIGGRIVRVSWGFGPSSINIRMEVVSDNGIKKLFYLRNNSIVTDANGKYLNWATDIPGSAFKNKKVEIKYSTITDATGAGAYENGKNGILSMHYIDWVK